MDVVLDTNVLVLLTVGVTDPRIISSHKRLKDYEISDYGLLCNLLSSFNAVVLIPNILAEAASLLWHVEEPARTKLRKTLAVIVERYPERYLPSQNAVQQNEYARLGLTDAAILAILSKDLALITSDAGLHRAAIYRGHQSTNFFQYKEMADPGLR